MGSSEKPKPVVETHSVASETSDPQKPVSDPVSTSTLDEIIMLESDTGAEDMEQNNLENPSEHGEKNSNVSTSGKEDEDDDDDEPVSLSELSSNFQKCFQSNNQNNKTKQPKKSEQQPSGGILQLKPFDYEAARKQVKFGEKDREHASSRSCDGDVEKEELGGKKKRSTTTGGQGQSSDLTKQQLAQGKRRQAFPASGNRSATFR